MPSTKMPPTQMSPSKMRPTAKILVAALAAFALPPATASAAGDPSGHKELSLQPIHDTWATHDDGKVHGAEKTLKVGIERQACDAADPKNICTKKKPAQYCCKGDAKKPAFCAPDAGECSKFTPVWTSYRKFRAYLRFDLGKVPEGKVVKATLNLRVSETKEVLGGPPRVLTTRLKKIGSGGTCAWDEKTLSDTNLTTWSSLPQNLSLAKDPVWTFDVRKAVADWLNGDADKKGSPIAPNCGFHLHDPDFGNATAPIERWVTFSSKEGVGPPTLQLTIAVDGDKDGYTADVDCDDADKAVNPGAEDVCDGIDNDCSGGTDDEVCDGVDNDCDGTVDEDDKGQPAPCPTGQVCANHACIKACKDECAGPTHRKCEWDAKAKRWVVVGCVLEPGATCRTWKSYEPCNAGQSCNYGSCSSNCVDMCDKKGEVGCDKDKLGRWHVVECGDWDTDTCLENKILSTCKPGGLCAKGTCDGSGCSDDCTEVGKLICMGKTAQICMDSDKDGCLDTKKTEGCKPNNCVAPLGCALPGSKPGGGEPNGSDTGTTADAGTVDATTGTDTAPATDTVTDTASVADAGTNSDTGLTVAKPRAKADDDGCSSTPTSEHGTSPMLLVLAVLGLVVLRRRRQKTAPPA